MQLNVLYLARLREAFGRGTERVDLPAPATVADLVALLHGRGGAWTAELAPGRAVRVAVNQEMASAATPLGEGDEVALFPPVTGG